MVARQHQLKSDVSSTMSTSSQRPRCRSLPAMSHNDLGSDGWTTEDSDTASVCSDVDVTSNTARQLTLDSSASYNTMVDTLGSPARKTVLVTGGAGFIGSAVAGFLLARGDDVAIVDELNDYYNVRIKRANLKALVEQYGPVRCRIYEGDICDVPFISGVFEKEKPKWIVHMAARAGVRPSIQDPFLYVYSNVEGTTRLLELARQHEVHSFVFASSSSVYGGSSKELFSEEDIVDYPVSPYAATKKSCELIAHTYHHLYGLNVSGLRFFTVYGPGGRPDMAPFMFIDKVWQGKEIQQFGDGTTSRDYTYITDIVDGVVRALDQPMGYQIYNLGNGKPIELSKFINLVQECVGKKAVIRVLPPQPGDVPRTCADITKARRQLGYEPKVSFEEGIKRTVEWHKTEYVKTLQD